MRMYLVPSKPQQPCRIVVERLRHFRHRTSEAVAATSKHVQTDGMGSNLHMLSPARAMSQSVQLIRRDVSQHHRKVLKVANADSIDLNVAHVEAVDYTYGRQVLRFLFSRYRLAASFTFSHLTCHHSAN